MHLAEEMVCQTSVVVEPAQVGAANVANLKLLVARRTGSVCQGLELTFLLVLSLLELPYLPKLSDGLIDRAIFGENPDLLEANINVLVELVDCFVLYFVSLQSSDT
jgi:hypothetical protein